jgi:hypothetical protein
MCDVRRADEGAYAIEVFGLCHIRLLAIGTQPRVQGCHVVFIPLRYLFIFSNSSSLCL